MHIPIQVQATVLLSGIISFGRTTAEKVGGNKKPKITQFHLGEHLKHARETIYSMNKNDGRELYPGFPGYGPGDPRKITYYPDNTGDNPSATENPTRVDLSTTIKPLPFGDGPGVAQGLPEGTKEFWEGTGTPTKMWEVIACPVAVS